MRSRTRSFAAAALAASIALIWANITAASAAKTPPSTQAGAADVAPSARPARVAPNTPFPPFGPATSLLVVAPHPDDESLCCAGVIQRVLGAGGGVSIVWITSGDGSEVDLVVVERSLLIKAARLRELALKRMQESRNAMALLGVAPDRLFFLGYPDRGVLPLVTNHYLTPFYSRYTDSAAVPYSAALFPGHPYTGESLERDFAAVLDRVHPTLVLAPSPRDLHPDHRATGILTIRAMARRNELTRVRYWIVHGGELWPMPRGYQPDFEMKPSPRARGLFPMPFHLQSAEVQRKRLAVSAYHTQMEVMSSFLLSFVRSNELYSSKPMPNGVPSLAAGTTGSVPED